MEQPIEKKHGNKGRVASEKQKESLKLGLLALKNKREAIKLARIEKEKKIASGEIADSSEEELIPLSQPNPIVPTVAPVVKQRKIRKDIGEPRNYLTKDDFEKMQNTFLESVKNPVRIEERIVEKPIEKIVEKEVEKIVERTKILSGSDLLNKIFFDM